MGFRGVFYAIYKKYIQKMQNLPLLTGSASSAYNILFYNFSFTIRSSAIISPVFNPLIYAGQPHPGLPALSQASNLILSVIF